MGQPAARVGDMHTCPIPTHIGGPVLPPGNINVLIGSLPAATITNMCTCVGPPDMIARGSSSVFINNLPAARMGDMTLHSGAITLGDFTVLIGGMATVTTGLGIPTDALAALSPSLQAQMRALQSQGWTVQWGTAGGGSFADRSTKTITVDPADRNNPVSLTQTLAHEAGHAGYNYQPDVSSRRAYVNGALADEGAATLNNIRVQREITANGGADIGIAGDPANHPAYNAAYDQYTRDNNEAAARNTIGGIFGRGERTSNTNQPYEDYYGGWYDQNYPPPPRRRP